MIFKALNLTAGLFILCGTFVYAQFEIIVDPLQHLGYVGSDFSLSVSVPENDGYARYQWIKDGAVIPGATSFEYVKSTVRPQDAGNYQVRVMLEDGRSITSKKIPVVLGLSSQNYSIYVDRRPITLRTRFWGPGPVKVRWEDRNYRSGGILKDNWWIRGASTKTLQLLSSDLLPRAIQSSISLNDESLVLDTFDIEKSPGVRPFFFISSADDIVQIGDPLNNPKYSIEVDPEIRASSEVM